MDTGSREDVQLMVAKAKELGATVYAEPQDHGWMYQHSFADLDGHHWNSFIWMKLNYQLNINNSF